MAALAHAKGAYHINLNAMPMDGWIPDKTETKEERVAS